MYVNGHAKARLRERLPADEAERIIDRLEATPGEPGLIAVILARLGNHTPLCGDRCRVAGPHIVRGDQRTEVELRTSNGDTVVAIVDGGEVTTVYYRRSWNQRLDAAGLDVDRVVDWGLKS